MWWQPSTWNVTEEDSLWLKMLHQILTEPAQRNDFESHGYNLYSWLMPGMALIMAIWASIHLGMFIGIPAALAGLCLREIVIDKRHVQPTDIISGMLFIILAVLTVSAIEYAALAPYQDLIERADVIRQLIAEGTIK